MPLSYILLSITGLVVLFGFAHRVLDRMKMTDTWAFLVIIGMIIGTLIPNIPITKTVSINIGGAAIPIAVCVYLFLRAESTRERVNAVVVSIVTGIAVFIAGRILPAEPEAMIIEPKYIYGIVGGLIAYLFSRSRRSAFIAGVMGIMLANVMQAVSNYLTGTRGAVPIGGAGFFDSVVISMIIAVFLSEIIGETREKIQGGTSKKHLEPREGMASSLIDTNKKEEGDKNEQKEDE
ncbi:Protein of unknown function [Thermoanaerobacter thermohydrosulfuricus]|uniref:DUF1614 domain-containing protein n=3 Tax=Thermoanaerobacter TaxID=1754 RepID=G2MT95_9THEO|nr:MULTISPECIES: DUF1614 domain-containing protein [Thermoanaerobacter]AEM78987.1 protein of unknown function DUF1614 [Thermoanaerobacter wiegelii Rt8.B1]EMT38834.1 Protein of unknown function (DUF1614) [Thermoanaerobacter thermohydrosulfuricus WC1]UZQ82061.1 DUF1614 domain-containing protein [Thermoanaerobacter sp. RKWS2]SDG06799.1 Protein of unknown function [Thermoanaerobacter thermohydrosulfuricus]